VRFLFLDEVDAYPGDVEGEGDPISLAEKRTTTFARRKVFLVSTPTVKDTSKIEREFEKSDQRRFFVACPHCGHKQWLRWRGYSDDQDDPRAKEYRLVWLDEQKTAAGYKCEGDDCGALIEEHHKTELLAGGEWRPTAEGDGVTRGYHISALYSPAGWKSWVEILREFEESSTDPAKLKTFVNTVLGETFEEAYAAKLDAESLSKRAEPFELLTAPSGALVCTAGVDVQDNRIEVQVVAWGEGEEAWVVNYAVVYGDPTGFEIWRQVLDVIDTPVLHASGVRMQVYSALVDSGDGNKTNEVYTFARQHRQRHVLAGKGFAGARPPVGSPSKQDINIRGQRIKSGVALYPVGVDTIKSTLYGRLQRAEREGPGVVHFPLGLPEDYYLQLTAEKQVTKLVNGFPRRMWVKKPSDRNEALDTFVYAYAALHYCYSRHSRATFWAQMAGRLEKIAPVQAESAPDELDAPLLAPAGVGRISLTGWKRA
jgi:phage terminase large subunit GpA-like protein